MSTDMKSAFGKTMRGVIYYHDESGNSATYDVTDAHEAHLTINGSSWLVTEFTDTLNILCQHNIRCDVGWSRRPPMPLGGVA